MYFDKKSFWGFVGLLLASGFLVYSQTPEPAKQKNPPMFSVLNLVHSSQPVALKIGTMPVGEGSLPLGFYTGAVSWAPATPLNIECQGFSPLRIPPPAGNNEGCPLYILQEGLEKPPGGGEPKPALKFLLVENSQDRPPTFCDVMNLTSKEKITCALENKEAIVLPKGKRTRVSTRNGLSLQVENGPTVSVSPSERPNSLLIVFYDDLEGKITFAVTDDIQFH